MELQNNYYLFFCMAKKRLRSILHILVKQDSDLYGDVRKTVNDARGSKK